MKLIYIYHSGFALEGESFTVIIDYYKDSASQPLTGVVHDELIKRPGKLYVLSSHSHADHFNPEVLEWKKMHPDIQYVFSKDILENGLARLNDACYLSKGEIWSDGVLEVEAFGSTDLGISFLLRLDGKLIFHAGDLNWWHWSGESDRDNMAARAFYFRELKRLNGLETDILFFPVDARQGEAREWGVRQFMETVTVKQLLVPMHAFGPAWKRSYAFRWRFPNVPVWIPQHDGEKYKGELV